MRIAYSWTGDPYGRPVLIVPSIMHGYAFPERVAARLAAEGIPLWAIQRPGMGNSHARSYDRETDVTAIGALVEALSMGDVVMLSLTGTPDPLECGLRSPKRWKSVLMASMASPPTRAVRKMFPRTQVAMIGACRKSPLLGKLIVETAMRNGRRRGMDWLVGRILDNSPADQAAMRDPEMRPLLRNAFEFNLTYDPEIRALAYSRTLDAWDLPIEELAVPVHALVGTNYAYYHPPSIEQFARRSERFTCQPVPGGGLKLFYQEPEVIADHVIAAVNA